MHWRHAVETLYVLQFFCEGNSMVVSSHKEQERWTFDDFFVVSLNKVFKNQSSFVWIQNDLTNLSPLQRTTLHLTLGCLTSIYSSYDSFVAFCTGFHVR